MNKNLGWCVILDILQVKGILKRYFDAFYEVNVDELSILFHEAMRIYSRGENGALEDICKENFIKIVKTFRPNSENPDFIRDDEILAIDFISEDVAVARVKLRFDNYICTDIVNMMRVDGVWSIVSILDTKEVIQH